MNLYKLTLIDEKVSLWDAYHGFVIASETPQEARKIANGDLPEIYDESPGDEQFINTESYNREQKNNIWLNSKYTKIQKIGIASKGIKKGVILVDFWSG